MQKKRNGARFIAMLLAALLIFTSMPLYRINAFAAENEDAVIVEKEAAEVSEDDLTEKDAPQIPDETPADEGTAEVSGDALKDEDAAVVSDEAVSEKDAATESADSESGEELSEELPEEEPVMEDDECLTEETDAETDEAVETAITEETLEKDLETGSSSALFGLDDDIASGSYENVTWRIDAGGTLYVTGTGNAYPEWSGPEWEAYKDDIKAAVVDLKGATTLARFFHGCTNLEAVDLSKLDTSKVTDMNWMFYKCSSLTSVDVTKFDTSNVTDMGGMFWRCGKLKEVDVSGFNTGKVEIMSQMFMGCTSLESLDVSHFDTKNVTLMDSLFGDCTSLESLDVSGFNTQKVVSTAYMFSGCEKLTSLDLSGFVTSNVGDMLGMFYGCKSLTSLNLSKFNTSNVTDMTNMFRECESLTTLDLKSFDTRKVKREGLVGGMNNMFRDCKSLMTLDLSSFDLTNLTKITNTEKAGLLKDCNNLRTIKTLKNLTLDISLPMDGWKRSDNKKEVTMLPQGLTKSITLTRTLPAVTNLDFEVKEFALTGGETVVLSVIATPAEGDTAAIKWTSSDNSIVKVEGRTLEATITAIDAGEATITAAIGSVSATVKVTVTTPVKFDKHVITLLSKEGSKETITATVNEGYSADTLVWTTSDDKVVTVDKGVVTAAADLKESGNATITATTPDGKYHDSCEVTVFAISTAKAPTASLEGEVEKNTRVTLKSETGDALIYYTADGTDPSLDAEGKPQGTTKTYINPIVIEKACTIKAFAVCKDLKDSQVVSFTYTIKQYWGDVENDDAVKALFTNAEEIPDDLWYVIDGKFYTTGGETDVEVGYTGDKITFNQDIKVFHGTRRLWENRDYTLTYLRNQTAAKKDDGNKAPTVTVKGKGSYTKTAVFTFTIAPRDLMFAVLDSEKVVTVASGSKLSTVKPVVSFHGKKLTVKTDYKLDFYKGSFAEENKVPDSTKAELGTDYIIAISAGNNGNFAGSAENVMVKVVDSKSKSVVKMSTAKVTIPKQAWTGNPVDVEKLFKDGIATVKVNGKTLEYGEDKDYTVLMYGFRDAGKYNITIQGSARKEDGAICYVGDKKAVLEITGVPAKQVKVDGLATSVEYIGRKYELSDLAAKAGGTVALYCGADKLVEYADYVVELTNNGSVGKINVEFTLRGQYTGTIKKTVTVKAKSLKDATVEAFGDADYRKTGAIPEKVTVKIDDVVLREGIDYTLSYKNNAKVADSSAKKAPTVTAKGIGNYTGTASSSFTVKKPYIDKCVTLEAADKEYKDVAGNFKVVPKLMDDGKALTVGKGKDVEKYDAKTAFTYYNATTMEPLADNAKVPSGTVIEVRIKVTCSTNSPYRVGTYVLKGQYKLVGKGYDLKSAKVTVKNPGNLTFNNGKAVIPLKETDLTIKLGNKTLNSNEYEIVSIKNNNFLGTATAVIRGKGEYGGSKKFTFKVGAKVLK